MRTIAQSSEAGPILPITYTLTQCRDQASAEGFGDIFSLTPKGLYSMHSSRYFRPEQIQLRRAIRIEGPASSAENAVIYLLETTDGLKGTLTDSASRLMTNSPVATYIREIEAICLQMQRFGQHDC